LQQQTDVRSTRLREVQRDSIRYLRGRWKPH